MRLCRLELLAFGPFTDTALELGAEPALHVVYGRNEAGKSSALRALAALLFGIDERTADDHLHRKPELRIGARLLTPGGAELAVVRRKGRKHTLLDVAGEPLDDGLLPALLQGLTRELFAASHGLDHVSLRAGGEALLAGGGDVGESLFDAALGGRGVRALLAKLDAEAAALYAPRGRNPALNAALAAYREARREVGELELSARVWQQQLQGLAEAREQLGALERERRAAAAELARLARAERALPGLGKLREARARREALGAVAALPADAAEQRVAAQRELAGHRRDALRLLGELAQRQARRDALRIPEPLARLEPALLADLQDRLGRHRAAAADLPERRAEREGIRQEAARTLRGIGRELELADAEPLRPAAGDKARIRALARTRGGLEVELREARRAAADCERRRAELERRDAQAPATGAPADPDELRAALARARALGGAQLSLAKLEAELRELEARCAAARAGLAPWSGATHALAALPAPGPETVERFAREFAELAERERRSGEALASCAKRAAALERPLRELERAGELPSEAALAQARTRRDELWQGLRGALAVPPLPLLAAPTAELAREYERASRLADESADRLRWGAERVARHAALAEELAELGRTREAAERGAAALTAGRSELAAAWAQCWSAAALTPAAPDEMRAWLARLERARELELRAASARAERDELEARVRAAAGALAPLLGAEAAPLAELIESAERRLETLAEAARARAELARAAAELAREHAALRAREADCVKALAHWQEQWAAAVRALRLAPDALPEQAEAVLAQLELLFEQLGREAQLCHRIESMERDAAQFAERLERLDPAPTESDPRAQRDHGERAEQLLARAHAARADLALRARLDEELETQRADLAQTRRGEADAEQRVGALLAAAAVATAEELPAAEERSRQARELDSGIALLEGALLEQGEGRTLAELEAEAAQLDPSELAARRGELESRLELAAEEIERAKHHAWGLERGLERLRERSAVDAAQNAAAELARVRELAGRTARLRLGAALLRREIERYRRENQGPVLARAGELFGRLTLGEWSGLRVGFSAADEPVLRCVRAAGAEVGVEGLSDGTRDQLYLALRLSTLLHRLQRAAPLPLVLDDVLVHFDDERSRAALAVLGEVAAQLQILLFTHHPRVAELARQAVPAARLREHDLDTLRGRPPAPGESAGAPGR